VNKGGLSIEELGPETIRTIEISVDSAGWDRLSTTKKVDLLERTFKLLLGGYSEIGQAVRLRFDDRREEFEIAFEQ